MGLSWSAVYTQTSPPPDFRPSLTGVVEVRQLGQWFECAPSGMFNDVVALGQELSAVTPGQVVVVEVQTTASVFAVRVMEGGRTERTLVSADGVWREVAGAPQPWELALFSDARRQSALDAGEDEAAVVEAFGAGVLVQGGRLPQPDAFEAMLLALGVTAQEWSSARSAPALQVLNGRKVRPVAILLMLAALGFSAGATIVHDRDWRALFGSLGFTLLIVGGFAAAWRKFRTGRLLF